MRIHGFAFGTLAAVVVCSGCAANSGRAGVPFASASHESASKTMTFGYTGGEQSFKVPAGVTSIIVEALGAAGGTHHGTTSSSYAGVPGYGGRVTATIPVKPGETLHVFVGGSAQSGGFNGGGHGAYRGGGATDLRAHGDALSDRILVAGGGGGIGPAIGGGGYNGGGGGGRKGDNGRGGSTSSGSGAPGQGGTQTNGGAGGASGSKKAGAGTPGKLGFGGNGGEGHSTRYVAANGSGGGGGYYGGGGGGGGAPLGNGGAGGGGSGYVEPSATNVHMLRNFKGANGDGSLVINW